MRWKIGAAFVLAAGISVSLALGAQAQETQTVNATVSALAVSLTVDPGSVDYGTMSFQTSRKSTDVEAGGITFTATNTGNASESFLVHGAAATGSGFSWELIDGSPSCGSVANQNKYRHSVKVVAGPPAIFLHTYEDTLATAVPLTGTVQFFTELYMPCAGSDGSGEVASTAITVVATSP